MGLTVRAQQAAVKKGAEGVDAALWQRGELHIGDCSRIISGRKCICPHMPACASEVSIHSQAEAI